jgi:CP family cyanate transporter-like MFS transporter
VIALQNRADGERGREACRDRDSARGNGVHAHSVSCCLPDFTKRRDTVAEFADAGRRARIPVSRQEPADLAHEAGRSSFGNILNERRSGLSRQAAFRDHGAHHSADSSTPGAIFPEEFSDNCVDIEFFGAECRSAADAVPLRLGEPLKNVSELGENRSGVPGPIAGNRRLVTRRALAEGKVLRKLAHAPTLDWSDVVDLPCTLWQGRTIALFAIVLLAVSLRTAVAGISPIVAVINADVAISTLGLGILGMLPPMFFAASGLIAPQIARKVGLEAALALAVAVMVVGHLVRALSGSFTVLIAGTVLALLGMGLGNVLIPPAVKRYFPDRVGFVTAAYATIMSVGAALPALLAAPVASSLGWRFSLGMWALLAAVALVPWILLLHTARVSSRAVEGVAVDDALIEQMTAPRSVAVARVWRSPIALAMTLAFSVCSVNAYAAFAWLPRLLVDQAGVSAMVAGGSLALFAITGLPAGIFAPVLVVQLRRPGRVIHAGVAMYVVGYLGLLLIPATATWLWVALIGLGSIMFPACLVLINVRSRSHEGSVALSGFMQGIGYAVGATGPLVVGLLFELTSGWFVPLLFLLGTALTAIFAGSVISRAGFVEDELVPRR